MSEFKKYQRKGLSEMRPYIKGEDLSNISVSKEDNPEEDMGMIARNPNNHNDQWYVARKYFEDNLELVNELPSSPGPYGLLHLGRGSFGDAVKAAKDGKKVCRSGWNGKEMYAIIMPGYPEGIEVNETTRKAHNLPEGTKLIYRPYWQLYTAQKDVAMWAPSGSDSLADDWMLVE